ncbi:MAG: hypothetical protein LBP95_09015 [Deltaproteobacteria bacterium]|nr:hypothetical protein [Deltaproteobacteria bacterium]
MSASAFVVVVIVIIIIIITTTTNIIITIFRRLPGEPPSKLSSWLSHHRDQVGRGIGEAAKELGRKQRARQTYVKNMARRHCLATKIKKY